MAVNAVDNGIRGITNCSLKWLPTNSELPKLIVLPTATGFVYNPNVELETISKNSKLGVRVVAQRLITATEPEIELTFGQKTLSILAMSLGYAWEAPDSGAQGALIDTFVVGQGGDYPAAAAGTEGKGVVADAVTIASVEASPGKNTALTQQPFASFAPATTMSFAIGADNARKFSTDLIGKTVSLETPIPLGAATDVLKIADTDFTTFELRMSQILVDRTMLDWYFPSVSIKLDDAELNEESETSITFSINDSSGGCNVPDVTYRGQLQRRTC